MSPTEKVLSEIWAQVLRRDAVGPDDDFFQLGGNSLTAVRMAGMVQDQLGVEPPLGQLFEHRTLAAFARCVDASRPGASADEEQGVI